MELTRDAGFGRAQAAADLGVGAGFGFPVFVGTDVVAVLEFFAPKALLPDDRQTLLRVLREEYAVGQFFEDFSEVSDAEVVAILRASRHQPAPAD